MHAVEVKTVSSLEKAPYKGKVHLNRGFPTSQIINFLDFEIH